MYWHKKYSRFVAVRGVWSSGCPEADLVEFELIFRSWRYGCPTPWYRTGLATTQASLPCYLNFTPLLLSVSHPPHHALTASSSSQESSSWLEWCRNQIPPPLSKRTKHHPWHHELQDPRFYGRCSTHCLMSLNWASQDSSTCQDKVDISTKFCYHFHLLIVSISWKKFSHSKSDSPQAQKQIIIFKLAPILQCLQSRML